MIRLADHLAADDVKAENVKHHHSGHYFGSGYAAPPPTTDAKDILHRIGAVKNSKINAAVRSIPAFEDEDVPVRAAWSHYMAAMCSRHFFPDANHRTSALTFTSAYYRATGIYCFLPKETTPLVVRASKDVRDMDIGGDRIRDKFTVAKIADAEHEYRNVFRRFEPMLVFRDGPPESGAQVVAEAARPADAA